MKYYKILAALLALVMLLSSACAMQPAAPETISDSTAAAAALPETAALTSNDIEEKTATPESATSAETAAETNDKKETTAQETQTAPATTTEAETLPPPKLPEYGEYYYDVKNVVLYLKLYGELPDNYLTKNEARKLGWEGGSVDPYAEGGAIGGDRFGNYEGLLPEGTKYTECDIDTEGSDRGAKRLVFSADGRYYYTADHYESFAEVTVGEDYEVEW